MSRSVLKKVAFISFGCKVNQAEVDEMIKELHSYGGVYEADFYNADYIIVNSCAVTEKAAKDGKKMLSNIKRKNPHIIIIATGCLAEFEKEGLKTVGVDIVVGNADKSKLLETVFKSSIANSKIVENISRPRTRGFLKIQDGCDAYCTYCIIPKLRGAPTSKPVSDVVQEFQRFIDGGYKEVVLTGIHIGLYGRDIIGGNLLTLLRELIKIDGEYRIRLSSLEIHEITDELLLFINDNRDKICNHLHIPLQSGSDLILKQMGRRYTLSEFKSVVDNVKSKIDGVVIGTDVIVGFPGESEVEFQRAVSFITSSGVDLLHVFPYSRRSSTVADGMPGHLPQADIMRRADKMRAVGDSLKLKCAERQLGKELRVLAERGAKGHGDNYMLVYLPSDVVVNHFYNVTISSIDGKGDLLGCLSK